MSLRFASPLTLKRSGWAGGRPGYARGRRPPHARTSSACPPKGRFCFRVNSLLVPLFWVLSKFALLPKRDKGSWGDTVPMRAAAFELGIRESCSVRARRACRRRWPGLFTVGSEVPRSECTDPASPSACLSGVLGLRNPSERLSWLRVMRTGRRLVQAHPLGHCTDGEMEARAGKRLVQG